MLRPEVKLRSTLTPDDSGVATADLVGTPEHVAHTLAKTEGLPTIMDHVLGRPPGKTPDRYRYTEAQIHGPVAFSKDIARLVAPEVARRQALADLYRAFSRQFDVPLFWYDGRRFVSD